MLEKKDMWLITIRFHAVEIQKIQNLLFSQVARYVIIQTQLLPFGVVKSKYNLNVNISSSYDDSKKYMLDQSDFI